MHRRGHRRDFDTIVAVPSSKDRPGPHPLEIALGALPTVKPMVATLLRTGATPIDDTRKAHDNAFEAVAAANGRRVLIIDHTFVTGARVQSAASTLAQAGADVVAALVLGRVIGFRPSYPENRALWDRAVATGFSFDTCCLE